MDGWGGGWTDCVGCRIRGRRVDDNLKEWLDGRILISSVSLVLVGFLHLSGHSAECLEE